MNPCWLCVGQPLGGSPASGEGRYVLDLPVDPAPESLLAELAQRGVRIVSLNPKRETLEDYFLRRVREDAATPPATAPGFGRGEATCA